jgi:hypothetical protein
MRTTRVVTYPMRRTTGPCPYVSRAKASTSPWETMLVVMDIVLGGRVLVTADYSVADFVICEDRCLGPKIATAVRACSR